MKNLVTKFAVRDTTVHIHTHNEDIIHDKLPVGVYSVDFNPMQGFFLKIMGSRIEQPAKIYGDIETRISRCLDTYQDYDKSMGVLLTGEKGTGKTLFVNSLANAVIDRLELPVILVREPYHGEDFENFLREVGSCCMLFDEFGKMYKSNGGGRHLAADSDAPSQEKLLTLMDGMDRTKRLLLFSENNEYSISDFMMNRPSRIHYHFRYSKMAEDSMLEYCKEHDLSEKDVSDITIFYRMSQMFTFDMLQGLVREVVKYKIPVRDALQYLNVESKAANVYLDVTKVERCDEYAEKPPYKNGTILVHTDNMVKPTLNSTSTVQAHISWMNDKEESKAERLFIEIEADEIIYEDSKAVIYESDGFRIHTVPSPKRWTPGYGDYDF